MKKLQLLLKLLFYIILLPDFLYEHESITLLVTDLVLPFEVKSEVNPRSNYILALNWPIEGLAF